MKQMGILIIMLGLKITLIGTDCSIKNSSGANNRLFDTHFLKPPH